VKGRQPIARVSLGDFEFFYALTANRARPHSLGLGLEDYFPLVRDGGFILGHDYTNRKGAREWNFAVVEAVNDFIRSNDCKLIAVTQEICPTYMIMKRHYTDFTAYQTIIRGLTQNASICFEVPDHLLDHLRHNEISSPHGLRCWFGF